MKLDIAKLEDERCLVDFRCGKRGLGHIIVEAIVEKHKIKIWPVANS